jgi:hypothetical protein
MRVTSLSLAGALVAAASLVGCGAASNFNQIWGGNDEGGDSLYIEARAAYDRGDYDDALKKAEKLIERNPNNEDAAVLLGYIHLSAGGIDPYRLAREMIAITPTSTATDAGGTPLQDPAADGEAETEDDANDATSTLQKLGSLINLSATDFTNMQKEPYTGTTDLFASNPLIVPKEVTPELRQLIGVLRSMNSAIMAVCRFVRDDVKIAGDTRHADASCTKVEGEGGNYAKAHFLWAFSHLTEAMAFQSVLLYSTAESGDSNFKVASDKLNATNFEGDAGVADFTAKVTDLKAASDLVFDTASNDSMIATTFRALEAVDLAFGVLTGLPEGITKKITGAMDKIREVGTKIGGEGSSGNITALKGQMTDKVSKSVGKKVDDVITKKLGGPTKVSEVDGLPGIPDATKDKLKEQITSMCESYDALAAGGDPDKIAESKPASCG